MCDVHLIEQGREVRNLSAYRCCYCGEPIPGQGTWVWGTLDDGTPGVFSFAYHTDCAEDMEWDAEAIEEGDGCFSYGSPVEGPTLPG